MLIEAETTCVEFKIGEFHQGYQKIIVEKKENRFIATYIDSLTNLEGETNIDLTEKEYKKFVIHYRKAINDLCCFMSTMRTTYMCQIKSLLSRKLFNFPISAKSMSHIFNLIIFFNEASNCS